MKTIKTIKIDYAPHLIQHSSSSPDQIRGSSAPKKSIYVTPKHPRQSEDISKKKPPKKT